MKPDFTKYSDGLIPAIIQDAMTSRVLMLGYMNEEAYVQTINIGQVTFYSRSRKKLWTKGETSGNYMLVDSLVPDCDNDCILVKVTPQGPVCHTGNDTCFAEENTAPFLARLESIIEKRQVQPSANSYTSRLFQQGINKIAQKVGEETIELIIEAKDDNITLFLNEAADLLYHYLVLLRAKQVSLVDVEKILKQRHINK
ncbi:MAG: bifunctional phosphoribosyl-AMP cyclohydrolase/phosphoribosyl-ATP diphosphatase HisIE [Flavipsychrobacter sp.]